MPWVMPGSTKGGSGEVNRAKRRHPYREVSVARRAELRVGRLVAGLGRITLLQVVACLVRTAVALACTTWDPRVPPIVVIACVQTCV